MEKSKTLSSVLIGIVCSICLLPADTRPNIILYLSDDLGYADVGFMGHPYAITPNLDKLAEQGTVFTQHYVTAITCAPSRTGIMTGVHTARFPKYPKDFGYGDQITVVELLKNSGYTTGHFGKWHLGPDESVGTHGYDEIFSETNNNNGAETPARDDPAVDHAINFIKKHANGEQPFYINISGHSTHYPVKTYPEYVGQFEDLDFDRRDFSATMQKKFDESASIDPDLRESMTQYLADVYGMDVNVGRILDTLDELGIAENTIFVYSSDHGPAPVTPGKGVKPYSKNMLGYAGEFRGGKHDQTEGGVRVPFVIRWPGKIEAGRVDEESVTSFMDWLPTLGSITGIENLPENLDGEDISDIWLGESRPRKTTLFWKTSSARSGVSLRKEDWKFHQTRNGPQLFDLSDDASESNNLADAYPEITSRLADLAEDWRGTLPSEYEKKQGRER
ncbi:MAG: sulfatase-like hydrolase/transferase [Verrucomicrobiota bacterium]